MTENSNKVTTKHELRSVQEERFERQMDMVFEAHPYYIESFKKRACQGVTSKAWMI